MLVIRSNKYQVPRFCNGLLSIESREGGKKFYAESAKYVDVDRDMVFILNRDLNQDRFEPTRSTIKKHGYGVANARCCELFGVPD